MIDYEKLKEIVGQLSLDAVNGKTEIPQHSSTRAYLVALIDVVDKCNEDMSMPYANEDTDYHSPFANPECEHEWDGRFFDRDMSPKCHKCGKYYR